MLMLTIIYIAFLGIGLPHYMMGAAWPSMFAGLNVPESYLGIVSMLFSGSTMIASVFSAKIRRYLSTGVIVFAGVLLTAVTVLGFALSNLFVLLCVLAVPMGMGMGFADAVLNNYMAVNYQVKHMNWLHGIWGVGAMIGPIILSIGLYQTQTWRTGYYITGGIIAGMALMLAFALPMWKKASGTTAPTEIKYGALFRLKGIKLTLASFFCYCSMESAVGYWGAFYLVSVRKIPEESAPQWISLFLLGLTAGRLLSGFLIVKISKRLLIRLGLIVFSLGAASLLWPEFPTQVGFILMGLGCAPVFPTMLHNTPALFGRENSQSVIGLQFASAFVGATVVPPLFGVIADAAGYELFPLFLGILLLATAVSIEMQNRAKTP